MKKSSRKKQGSSRQTAFTRFMLIVAVFVLWIGGISVRLVHLQVTQHQWLRAQAEGKRTQVKQSKLLRGTILDRNNRTLAMSVSAQTLYADPTEMEDTDAAAKTVAKLLKMDAVSLAGQFRQAKESKKRFVPIAKKVDGDTAQRLNKALDTPDVRKADLPNFAGLHWRDEQKRSYPQGSLAAQLIGFSNDSDEGVAGIEQSQDDILHGAIIKRFQERDRLGRVYDEEVTEREAPGDIVLTIDSAFQYMTEQALEKGVKNAQAKSGIAVVLNAKTGEILALANYPTFDPNTISSKTAGNISNNAIQSVYTPGSTFKLITYGAGLEKRLFNPNDMISAGNGTIEVAKHVFKDSHAVGTVNYSEALAHSSNVCAIKTALGVGREDFAAMVKKMGFGAKSGIELPAETSGIVRPLEKWNGDSLASMSIGYEIGVTALQMTSAFATIANDGIKVQPRIIKEIRKSGEALPQSPQPAQTQVVTKETARHLRTMLKQVVQTGTGKRAQLLGYTSAGKTGTAWKVNEKSRSVDASKYVSSFIGMAPADNPEIVVAVIMDEPKVGARDGGMVSAPVFSEIAQQLLHEMKVPTDAPIRQDNEAIVDIPETPAGTRSADDAKPVTKTSAASKPDTKGASVPDKKGKPKGVAWIAPSPDLSFGLVRRKEERAT